MTLTRTLVLPKPRTRRYFNARGAIITSSALVGALLVWQIAVLVFQIPSYILPSPLEIATGAEWGSVLNASMRTIMSTMLGFIAGNLIGFILAILISASPTLSSVIYPGAIVIRSIPVVALAPFITLAFGRGAAATIVVAAMIVFFPTLVNVLQGLNSVKPEALELMKVINASKVHRYQLLRIPTSMPSFFSALRIAAPNAVLGVMTAEWIVGGGLGHLIITSWLALRMPTMWGAVIASAVLAALLFALVSLGEKLVIGWSKQT